MFLLIAQIYKIISIYPNGYYYVIFSDNSHRAIKYTSYHMDTAHKIARALGVSLDDLMK